MDKVYLVEDCYRYEGCTSIKAFKDKLAAESYALEVKEDEMLSNYIRYKSMWMHEIRHLIKHGTVPEYSYYGDLDNLVANRPDRFEDCDYDRYWIVTEMDVL